MRYRVAFSFRGIPAQTYFTEWFDTFGEARTFTVNSDISGELFLHHIEDENEEII